MRKKHFIKRVAMVVAAALTVALCGQVSAEGVLQFGKEAALLAVGLGEPLDSAAFIGEKVHDTFTTTAPSVTAPTTAPTTAVQVIAPITTAPTKAAGAGTVLVQNMAGGGETVNGVSVRNRSGKAFDLKKEIAAGTLLAFSNTADPQVLIIHTHTTEGYLTYDTGFYNGKDVERTFDTKRNVCAAGEALKTALEKQGIVTVHDTTVHDNPQYTGAYGRSEATVKALLKKYPSVKVVLDLHRDAILPKNTEHVKPTATVNGKKAAQMMIIAGVVSTSALPHPKWQENFHFALQLQKSLQAAYPDLMRPLYLVGSRYNQHLSTGYLLVEVGTDVNTVAEAEYSATLLGNTIAKLLKR